MLLQLHENNKPFQEAYSLEQVHQEASIAEVLP